MATVNLRVVGIYMNEPVDLTLTSSTTVKDVMDTYALNNPVSSPRGFQYDDGPPRPMHAPNDALSPTRMTYNVPNDPDVLNTKGGRTIMPGQYTLSEPQNFDNPQFNAFPAFQYYLLRPVFDDEGEKIGTDNKTRGGGFQYFNLPSEDDEDNIEDGDTILWRQVSIKLHPDFFIPPGLFDMLPPPLRQLDDQVLQQIQQMRRTGMLSDEAFQDMVDDLRESGNEQVVLGRMEELLSSLDEESLRG